VPAGVAPEPVGKPVDRCVLYEIRCVLYDFWCVLYEFRCVLYESGV